MTASPRPFASPLFVVAAAALLIGYLALGLLGCRGGLGALDAHGILSVVNDRIQTGAIEVSRPPGHPLSENWVLPGLVHLANDLGVGPGLSPLAYCLYQLSGGLVCLIFFWLLLSQLPIPPWRQLLATACLAFSPQFLTTSSDGEEFLWSMAWVFAALLTLSLLGAQRMKWPFLGWMLAVAFGVAASGYRLEYGGVTLLAVFGTLLFSDQSWPRKISLAGFAAILLVVVWLPVLQHQGLAAPYPNPLSLKTRVGVGSYKLLFQSLGVVPLLIAMVGVYQARKTFRILPPFHSGLLGYWAVWLSLIYFLLFFVYPTKILVVLPGVALLILITAAYGGPRTWICFVLACMSLPLVHLDLFYHRNWTGLRFQPSLWEQGLAEKPYAKGPEMIAAINLASSGRHVLITHVWTWDLAWLKKHSSWSGIPDSQGEAYATGEGVVASRSIVNDKDLLNTYVSNGYEVWIDKTNYRESYMRYDLFAPTPETAVIDGITCRIVDVK